jgi:hypothetical protein
MTYDETKKAIQSLPQTWIPALLNEMVQAAVAKRVFRPGVIAEFVRDAEVRYRLGCDHNEMVESGDPKRVWMCAKCGHLYGKEELEQRKEKNE